MRKILLKTFFFGASFAVIFFSKTNASGPGSGYTNAPSESNCAQSGCHSTTSLKTAGNRWKAIHFNGNFTGSGYIPDSSYTIAISYQETGSKNKWGYQITALDGAGNAAGKFATVDSRSQVYNYTVGTKSRNSAGQTSTGSTYSVTDSTLWNVKWTAPSTIVGDITFYLVFNKADNNTNESGDSIYAKKFVIQPSTLLPTAKATIIDSFYCSNTTLTFSAAVTGSPSTYDWSFSNGTKLTNTNNNKPTTSFGSTGSAFAAVRAKNSKGYGAWDTLKFTVVSGAISPTINPGATNQNLCKGDTLSLNWLNFQSGYAMYWAPFGQNTKTIKVTDSQSYSLTVRASNGCKKTSATIKVTTRSKPSVALIKSFAGDTICSGTPFSLGSLVLKGPADSFSFSSAKGPYDKKDTLQKTLTSGPATYTLWGKNTFGCISTPSSITIQVKQPLPAPSVSVSHTDFTSITFGWSAISGATGYKISMDSGKTWQDPSSGSNGLEHKDSGLLGNTNRQILVIATSNGACTASQQGMVVGTTKSCTPIPFTISAASSRVCKNSNASVVVHGLAGMKYGIRVEGSNRPVDSNQLITVTGTKNFSISIIDSNALICGYTTKTIHLVEDTVLTPGISPSGTQLFCTSGSTANFDLSTSGNRSIDSVWFIKNGVVVSRQRGNTHFVYQVSNNDSVWVRSKKVSAGCLSDPSNKAIAKLQAPPSAAFNSSNVRFAYQYSATTTGGIHTWRIDTMLRSGDTANFDLTRYVEKQVKLYHTITKNGCSSTDSAIFTVPNFDKIKGITKLNAAVYPNPAKEFVNVVLPNNVTDAVLKIYSNTGQLLASHGLKPGANTIKTTGLPAGMLLYTLSTPSSLTTGSIVIER